MIFKMLIKIGNILKSVFARLPVEKLVSNMPLFF